MSELIGNNEFFDLLTECLYPAETVHENVIHSE